MNSELILDRMRKVANVAYNKDLAQFLGVSTSTISAWKKNDAMTIESVVCFSKHFAVDLNWLISGNESQPELSTLEKMLLTAFNDLDDKQKMEILVKVGGFSQQQGNNGITQNGGANNIAVGGNVAIEK